MALQRDKKNAISGVSKALPGSLQAMGPNGLPAVRAKRSSSACKHSTYPEYAKHSQGLCEL
eukprot:448566-Pelagomonas_calceolata.AAC.3